MAISTNILKRFGHNLTNLARQGKFAPLAGQDAVTERVFQVLSRQNKCNPSLIDPDSAWRVTVLQEIVRRMVVGEALETLAQKQIIALDKEALFAKPFDDLDEYWQHLEEHYKYQCRRLAPYGQQPSSYWQGFLNQEPLSSEQVAASGDYEAWTTFWVRQSYLASELDARLLLTLLTWFRQEWAFHRVTFAARREQQRQIELFRSAGLHLLFELPHSLVFTP